MAKMWAGRTDGATEKIADDFNSSIRFDSRMYREDIKGSMVHAAMLAQQNILTQEDADTLIAGLEGILQDIDSGKLDEETALKLTEEFFFFLRKCHFRNILRIQDSVNDRLHEEECKTCNQTEHNTQPQKGIALRKGFFLVPLTQRISRDDCTRLGKALDHNGTELLRHRRYGICRHKALPQSPNDHCNRVIAQCQNTVTDQNRNTDANVLSPKHSHRPKEMPQAKSDFFIL